MSVHSSGIYKQKYKKTDVYEEYQLFSVFLFAFVGQYG